jgi:hypothetical protein
LHYFNRNKLKVMQHLILFYMKLKLLNKYDQWKKNKQKEKQNFISRKLIVHHQQNRN